MLTSAKRQREFLKKQYGKNPVNDAYHYMRKDRLKLIAGYHEELGTGTVDRITWDDLDMDDVFFRINHTRSYVGEQVLYHKLHVTDGGDLEALGAAVNFYDENQEIRVTAEQCLSLLGKQNSSYYIPKLIRILQGFELPYAWIYRLLQFSLFTLLLLSIVLRRDEIILFLIGNLCVNLFIYMRTKAQSENMLGCLQGICGLIDVAHKMLSKGCTPDSISRVRMEESVKELHKLQKLAGGLISKRNYALADPQGVLADYLMGITLYDLITFQKIIRIVSGHEESVMKLYEAVGTIDMIISVASFRKSLKEYCLPDFIEGNRIEVEDLRHPMIEDAIPNTVDFSGATMIMGANASGKSTFMKAIAVNAILAQSIYTCYAQKFSMPRSVVMTSMAVRDDVLSGESYYVREIKYLKRMLDMAESNKNVIYLIDEILKGTNNKERLAASKAVLHYVSRQKGIVIVSTHDSELASCLRDIYDGYHFDSRLTDNGITFDYKIKHGLGEGSNAIDLLSCYDFPEEIVKEARLAVNDKNIA